jgi:outer membrane protein assembly factor BamB
MHWAEPDETGISFTLAASALRLSLGLIADSCDLRATDWPRFRGSDGNASSPDPIRISWATNNLPVAWRLDYPQGYGSVAVAEGKVFTLTWPNFLPAESCVALDARTGERLWARELQPKSTPEALEAALSTPSFRDGRLYVYTTDQSLCCLDSANGEILWARDVKREFAGGRQNIYGNSQSPWVEDGRVFVSVVAPTNCLLCFDASNGTLVWADTPTR